MLSLTRKTDYALLVLAAMARSGSDKTSTRDLADQSGVSVRLLANILNRLKHEGLIKSARGTKGGYGLAMDPDQITLTRLIEAVEGPMRLARCCSVEGDVEPDGCRLEESCITKEAVRRLHESLRSFLGQVTLRDLTWNTISLKIDLPAADHRYGRLPVMAH